MFVVKKWKSVVSTVLIGSILALGGMSIAHINTIKTSVDSISNQIMDAGDIANFDMSTTGNNVVVIMLDRAMGEYLPYIFNEKPELKEQFEGFTYYSNTISFGGKTNFGVPSMLGGYEYTPVEMNKRSDEYLVDKHNESLKVMPVLLANNGYDVTVCDPVYANYHWIPDLSIYDEYENIDAYITKGMFGSVEQKANVVKNNQRNFFCFAMMKTMPVIVQPTVYDNGAYYQIMEETESEPQSVVQKGESMSTSVGMRSSFVESYNALASMPNMTQIKDENKNTFLLFTTDLTHEPMLLQAPDYTLSEVVDNRKYDSENTSRFNLNGDVLKM